MALISDLPLFIRINALLARIEIEMDQGRRALTRIKATSDLELRQMLSDGTLAKTLHHVYSGLEAIFEDIAMDIDGGKPDGDHWHARLLDQMMGRSRAREPVISADLARDLSDLRRFRHFFRNAYGVDLRADEVIEKFERLERVVLPGLTERFQDLADHMAAPSSDDEPNGP